MKRLRFAALMGAFAALSPVIAATDGGVGPGKAAAATKLELGKLSAAERPSGCACAVFGADKETLIFDADRENRPVARVDGALFRFERTSHNVPKGRPKKGDTWFEEFSSGNLKLRLDRTVTFACAPDDESCEVTDYTVDVTLQQGSTKRVYRGLTGDCGC